MAEKIVNFEFCTSCKNRNKEEYEDPCDACLNEPVNTDSHRPMYYQEDKKNEKKKRK